MIFKNIFKKEYKLPSYEQAIKIGNKYKELLLKQDGDLPSYEQVMFEERKKQECLERKKQELLKKLAPELVEDGPPRGTCYKCNMNIYKSWKKNPDGVLFHKFCFYGH